MACERTVASNPPLLSRLPTTSQSYSPSEIEDILREKCSITSLRPFQRDLGTQLSNGQEIFLVIATGQGKTLVFLAPLVAAQARAQSGIAFFIVPTKALAEQQSQTAARYGLKAVALTEDTVREAQLEGRDLFKELWSWKGVRVAVMSPQMLSSTQITSYIQKPANKKHVRWMLIDEVHLLDDSSGTFQTPYRSIENARARLSSRTVWAAATGSLTPTRALAVAQNLGFQPGYYTNARYSLDRPNIKYIPRFFQYAHTGDKFFDISFLIPPDMKSASEIEPTLIFASTIKEGYDIMQYLDSLIPDSIPEREKIVKLFNSMFSALYRNQFKQDLENDDAPLRIGVATETLTYGIDLRIYRVVVLGIRPSHEILKQNVGRGGRDGKPAVAYTFAPAWAKETELTAVPKKKEKEDAKRREALPQVTREWYNPTAAQCSRAAELKYYGELASFSPESCRCNIHEEDGTEDRDFTRVKQWIDHFATQSEAQKGGSQLTSDRTYAALTKSKQESLIRLLEHWRNRKWAAVRSEDEDHQSAHFFFRSSLIRHLAERAHICSTFDRFRQEIGSRWDELYFAEHGKELFSFMTEAMKAYQEMTEEVKAMEKAQKGVKVECTDDDKDQLLKLEDDCPTLTVISAGASTTDILRKPLHTFKVRLPARSGLSVVPSADTQQTKRLAGPILPVLSPPQKRHRPNKNKENYD